MLSSIRCMPFSVMPTPLKAASDFQRVAKVSLDLAQQQMQNGNAKILLLLTAQQNYPPRLSDTAALFRVLGGGWWNRGDLPEQRIVNVGAKEADIAAERPGEVRSIGIALSGIFRSDTSALKTITAENILKYSVSGFSP
jgi:hypothetical protein